MSTEEKKECEPPPQHPIKVDRQWIQKLIQKYPNPNSRSQTKALVVAPMVDQSDLPFRLLCRRYGANLCFTPMIHARLLLEMPAYRQKFIGHWPSEDRPLIAQLCGSDPQVMLAAAKYVEPYVDGIDINCGCPQSIAKRGNYGAYLLEKEEELLTLVRFLLKHLTVPLSVKVRLLPPPEDYNGEEGWDIPQQSLNLYTKLVDAGIHLLTIHGRTRYQKSLLTGHSDWKTIRKAVDLLGHRIPIFANGSIQDWDDVEECLRITNCDGVMSSESVLEYPPIFYNIPQTPARTIGRLQLAQEYLDFVLEHPPNKGGQGSGIKCIRTHLHRLLHADLQDELQLRTNVVDFESTQELQSVVDYLKEKHDRTTHDVSAESLSWYMRYRLDPEVVLERIARNCQVKFVELDDDAGECFANIFGGVGVESADGPTGMECGDSGDY
jgi:tRNA-dihydrouridine synthase 1